jgi:hypothetical protein
VSILASLLEMQKRRLSRPAQRFAVLAQPPHHLVPGEWPAPKLRGVGYDLIERLRGRRHGRLVLGTDREVIVLETSPWRLTSPKRILMRGARESVSCFAADKGVLIVTDGERTQSVAYPKWWHHEARALSRKS